MVILIGLLVAILAWIIGSNCFHKFKIKIKYTTGTYKGMGALENTISIVACEAAYLLLALDCKAPLYGVLLSINVLFAMIIAEIWHRARELD